MEAELAKKDLPYVILMIVLDIMAPMFLMLGLTMTTSANASLLINFEIVATSVFALVIFEEPIDRRLWLSIILITLSFVIASIIMIAGTYFAVMERHDHEHTNMEHEHRHSHSDGHHDHDHETLIEGEHVHPHIHERLVHAHPHTPDLHHAHKH